jgi:hypothetical protein
VDAPSVYWTDTGDNGYSGTVSSVLLDGGSVTTIASAQNVPYGIALDGTSVYWTELSYGNSTSGAVLSKLLKSCPRMAFGEIPVRAGTALTSPGFPVVRGSHKESRGTRVLVQARPLRGPKQVVGAGFPCLARGSADGVRPHPLPAFWQVGYWAESVAPGDLEPLIGYVRQQRAHHRAHAGLEPSQLAPP